MKKIVGFVLTMMLMGALGAWAGETEGRIQSVDPSERVVVLEDGTKLWVAEGLSLDSLREGARIRAAWEERDGKNVVIGYEVQ